MHFTLWYFNKIRFFLRASADSGGVMEQSKLYQFIPVRQAAAALL